MTANGKIGDPIPKGAIEDTEPSILAGPDRDGTEAEKDVSDRSTVDLAAIRDELVQLRESVAELTEATTRYAKRRFESVYGSESEPRGREGEGRASGWRARDADRRPKAGRRHSNQASNTCSPAIHVLWMR